MTEINLVTPRAAHAERLVSAVLAAADAATLDALVAATADDLGVESAHLSLLTDRQVTGSACGPGFAAGARGAEAAFDDTVCANALRTDGPLVIADARTDARVSSIPAVIDGTLGAYLGAPLRSDDLVIGVLCVFERDPRAWTATELRLLEGRAAQVLDELERLAADLG